MHFCYIYFYCINNKTLTATGYSDRVSYFCLLFAITVLSGSLGFKGGVNWDIMNIEYDRASVLNDYKISAGGRNCSGDTGDCIDDDVWEDWYSQHCRCWFILSEQYICIQREMTQASISVL